MKGRTEQMVSQWMLDLKSWVQIFWVRQDRTACHELRSCESAIRSSEDRDVQVDRSYISTPPQYLLLNLFSERKTPTFRLILFPTLPFPNPACSSSLPHVPYLFPVISFSTVSSDLNVLEARVSLDSYTNDYCH